jgi:hypothetical protein
MSRVTLLSATSKELELDPLVDDRRYHIFELVRNERITADDWYQDVWHFGFRATDQSIPDPLPHVTTPRALFMRHLDINAVPKRTVFGLLKHFAAYEREREKLEEFCSPEGAVIVSPFLVRVVHFNSNRKNYMTIRFEYGERFARF